MASILSSLALVLFIPFSVVWALSLEGDLDMLMTIGVKSRKTLFASVPYATSTSSLNAISRIAYHKTPHFTEWLYYQDIGEQDAKALVDMALKDPVLTDRILPSYYVLQAKAIWNALKPHLNDYHPQFIDVPLNPVCESSDIKLLLARCKQNPSLIGGEGIIASIDKYLGIDAWMLTLGCHNLEVYRDRLNRNQNYASLVGLGAFLDLEYSNSLGARFFLKEIFSKKYPYWYNLLAFTSKIPEQYFATYKTILKHIKYCLEGQPQYFSLWHTKLTLLFACRFSLEYVNPGTHRNEKYRLVAYAKVFRDFVNANQNNPVVRPLYMGIHIAITELLKRVQDVELEKGAKVLMQGLPHHSRWLGTFEERRAVWRDAIIATQNYIEWPPAFEHHSDLVEFISTHLVTLQGLILPLGNKLLAPVQVERWSICRTTTDLLIKSFQILFRDVFAPEVTPTAFLFKLESMPLKTRWAIFWQIQANYLHFGQPLLPILNVSYRSSILSTLWSLFKQIKGPTAMSLYFTGQELPQIQVVGIPNINDLLSRPYLRLKAETVVTVFIIFLFLVLKFSFNQ